MNSHKDKPTKFATDLNSQTLYHGTKIDLRSGDLIEPGYHSNYGKRKKASYIYLTATLDAATWASLHRATDWVEFTSFLS